MTTRYKGDNDVSCIPHKQTETNEEKREKKGKERDF
jgi:hypothetical protein